MNKSKLIIAIPFAGGNKHSYKEIESLLPQDFEWSTLELPGRGSRFKERLLSDLNSMVNDLFRQIKPQTFIKKNYIIYGHSMGALLGYELAKKIIENKLPPPNILFLTGRGAPSTTLNEEKISTFPKSIFWKRIFKLGGIPSNVLESKELMDLYYPILKNDFRAIENYQYSKLESPLPIYIKICIGEEEIGNGYNRIPLGDFQKWGEETVFRVDPEILSGNHFFILDHPKKIAEKICNTINIVKKL